MDKWSTRIKVIMLFLLLLIVTACGGKSQESVVKNVEKKIDGMSGYKVKAEMKMNTGQEEQTYNVDVWFKKDNHYRVALDNDDNDDGQIILKNEDGVFVLTPALKKSFKFQTDWPENSSQPYLLQSLLNDVLKDSEAELRQDESHYIFLTKTNYQGNNHLPFQEIYFDKKSYLPKLVKVMDKEQEVLIEVTFSKLEANPKFANNDFNKEEILEEALASLPVISEDEEKPVLSIMYPLITFDSELIEKKEVPLEDGERVIMTFKGDKNFTLIQKKEFSAPVASFEEQKMGDPINLGHSIGSLSENRVEWTRDGIEFYLASEDMTVEELIEVASSVGEIKEK